MAFQSSSDILIRPVLRQNFVIPGIRHQAMGDLTGFAWMHPVIARDNADRDRQRAQLGGADADDRVVRSVFEAPPPSLITLIKCFTSIDSSRARFAGLLTMTSPKCSLRHTASIPPRSAASMN